MILNERDDDGGDGGYDDCMSVHVWNKVNDYKSAITKQQ